MGRTLPTIGVVLGITALFAGVFVIDAWLASRIRVFSEQGRGVDKSYAIAMFCFMTFSIIAYSIATFALWKFPCMRDPTDVEAEMHREDATSWFMIIFFFYNVIFNAIVFVQAYKWQQQFRASGDGKNAAFCIAYMTILAVGIAIPFTMGLRDIIDKLRSFQTSGTSGTSV